MSAREQLRRELSAGTRTRDQWDDLFWAACGEAADEEFERLYAAPQRLYLAELRARPRSTTPDASMADDAPALERWRRVVLERPKKYAPLDVAAAWELTAAECDRRGETDYANDARASARAQLTRKSA